MHFYPNLYVQQLASIKTEVKVPALKCKRGKTVLIWFLDDLSTVARRPTLDRIVQPSVG